MRGRLRDGFAEVEILLIRLALVLLAFEDGRADVTLHVEDLADSVAPVDVLRDPLGHDVLRALQGFFHVVDTLASIDITCGKAVDKVHVLRHDLCGEWLQPFLAGDGGASAAFGLVGEVEVFHLLYSLGVQYLLL